MLEMFVVQHPMENIHIVQDLDNALINVDIHVLRILYYCNRR